MQGQGLVVTQQGNIVVKVERCPAAAIVISRWTSKGDWKCLIFFVYCLFLKMWLILIVLTLGFLIILDYFNKKRRYELTRNIPGPMVIPIIGNIGVLTVTSVEAAVQRTSDVIKDYGPNARVWIYNWLVLFCTDPKFLEALLSSPQHITKSSIYDFLRFWLNDGLLLSSRKKWHQRRKIITPTFHFKILEEFVEVFDRNSGILVKLLEPLSGKGAFDIDPFIRKASLDIIAETAMSTNIKAQENPSSKYVRAVTDVTEIMTLRVANIYYQLDILFYILAPRLSRRVFVARKTLHEFTDKIITQRREQILQENLNSNTQQGIDNDVGVKRKSALLDILLQSTINGKPLTNADIREEVDTFMFEGHDTTSAGVNFALYCISRYPTVQEKIFQEIREVLGDNKNEPVDLRKLNDLKYLELVIKETLRLYPPVPIIARLITEDTIINGQTLPAGQDIVIPIYVLHKNPDVFPKPEEFRPERYALENIEENMNPFSNIPFSAGPRNCIGQKFAMLEMKSVISKILRHYELLRLGPEPDVKISMIIRSANGIHLGLKPRIYS